MDIIERPLADIRPYEKNPRKNRNAVKAVADSIREYGFRQPIVVDEEGVIIVGHTRLEAAKRLGLDAAPVHVAEGLSPEQARAYRLMDNRSHENSSWDEDLLKFEFAGLMEADFDLDLTGFTGPEINALLDDDGSLEGADEVLTPPENPVACLGDIWQCGPHRIVCGDATAPETWEALGEENIDAILTDPPYCSGGFQEAGRAAGSVGTTAQHQKIVNDTLSTRGYQALMRAVLSRRAVKVAYVFTDWRMWVNLFDIVEASGYGVRSMIVWDKGTPGMGMGWRSQHELIMCGVAQAALWKGHQKLAVGNVITEQRSGNKMHTTEKPVAVLSRILGATPFAETVGDPFLGSGTTLVAAQQLGRIGYGIEISPAYVDVACQRLEKHVGEPARKVAEL